MKEVLYTELSDDQRKLVNAAAVAMETAYNPYSGFYVGAALLAINGDIITGSNVENAGYNPTNCAERSAVFRANAQGIRQFTTVAVIARGKDFDTKEVTAPCGPCRQVLYEMSQIAGVDMEVVLSTTKKDKIVLTTIKELLPLAFGPKDLGIDVAKYR